jgi:hypothetical protein
MYVKNNRYLLEENLSLAKKSEVHTVIRQALPATIISATHILCIVSESIVHIIPEVREDSSYLL